MTIRIAHISDSHIGNIIDHEKFSSDIEGTEKRFKAVLSKVKELRDSIDIVIHNGDLVHTASKQNYELANKLLSETALPTLLVVGNHDSREKISKSINFSEEILPWNIENLIDLDIYSRIS